MVYASTVNDVPRGGRRRERELIAALLAGAVAGDGGSLVLCGDRGMGKTTLLETAADLARDAGFTVLWSGVDEAESPLPFAGLHRLLRAVLHRSDRSSHDQGRALLRVVEAGGGARDPFALGVGLLRLLGAAARDRPVLCCVDDADWLDAPSGDALAFVARRLSGERVSIMLSSGGGRPWPGIRVEEVAPLDRGCSLDLLRHLGLADEVAAALAAVGHGNPRALIDLAGSLSAEQRRGDEPPPEVLPPDSGLRRAYRDRLARLPDQARRLLVLAAADGDLTADDLVRAAAAAGVDLRALEPAESSGLVRVAAGKVTFPQPLLRAVAYHEATFAQRRSAHALLAEIVDPAVHPLRHHLHRAAVVSGPDARLAARLACAAARPGTQCAASARGLERSAELTEDPVVAARRRLDAARYAWRAGEPYRAKPLIRQAVRATAAPLVRAQADLLLGEIELRGGATAVARQRLSATADALTADDRHQALAALMAAGESLCMSGDFGRYPELARRAQALRRPVEPPAAEFVFAHIAGVSATLQGRHAQAVEPLRRAVTLAAALDDPVSLTRGSMAALLLGDESQTYRLAMAAVARARAEGDLAAVPQALEFAALAQLWLGRPDTAATDLLEGLHLARATGQDNVAGSHLTTLAVLAAVLGDRQTCMLRVREAASCRPGRGGSWSYGDWALAVLDLAAGRAADVVSRMRAIAGRGHLIVRVAATPHLVEAAVQCGERRAAAQALLLFDSWASNAADPSWLALSARCHALLARTGGEADEWFRQALRHHQSSVSELDRARTQLLYGQHLRRRRRPVAAREHLRSAREAFQRLAADAWADRTAAELRAAGDQVEPHRVVVSDTLTAQQLQIARLVVAGATNREVAAQLVLSTRTVDHHLRNIFARLGIRSRVDLAKLLS